jgi:hypothetical protein
MALNIGIARACNVMQRVFVMKWTKCALLGGVLALDGCAQLEARPELPVQVARTVSNDTHLDKVIGEAEAAHPGESAFRLVSDGREAFVLRWFSAEQAERSLDVATLPGVVCPNLRSRIATLKNHRQSAGYLRHVLGFAARPIHAANDIGQYGF